MKIEVLVATMFNNDIEKLYKTMNLKTDAIFVNQCDCLKEEIKEIKIKDNRIKIIMTKERGISKSRNKALQNVSKNTDIIIFSDDDIKFSDDYCKEIESAYINTECDGIVFNVKKADGKLNKKISKIVNQINLFRARSVSLTFKYGKISNFKFDEDFGTGSNKYILGEENVFVSDCLKKGLKIITNNYIMCEIENRRPSTWFRGINEEFFLAKGASFKRMHKYLYFLFNLDFAIRKYSEYKKNESIISALKFLFKGSFDYKKELRNKYGKIRK